MSHTPCILHYFATATLFVPYSPEAAGLPPFIEGLGPPNIIFDFEEKKFFFLILIVLGYTISQYFIASAEVFYA